MARWPRSSEPAIITAEMRAAEDNPQQPSAVPEARSDRKGHGSETSSEGKEHHAQAGRAVSRALRL